MVPGAALAAPAAETVQFKTIVVQAIRPKVNLLHNAGFEAAGPRGIPAEWQWDRRNTDATCSVDTTTVHCGRRAIKITNGTAFGAHVYGMLWQPRPLKLAAGKPYTMSAWVKSDAPGIVPLIGGREWQFRIQAHATGGQWHRIQKTFTPAAEDCDFVFRINTESPTAGIWIDDVKVEEGPGATLDPAESEIGAAPRLDVEDAEATVQGDGPFGVKFLLVCPRAIAGALEVTLSSGETIRQPISLAAGMFRLLVNGEMRSASDAPRTVTLRLEDAGKEAARIQSPIRFYSPGNALTRLADLRAKLPSLKADLQGVKARRQDISYPQVTLTVLENFVRYAEEDVQHAEVKRSLEQIDDLERMAARLNKELKEALAGDRRFAPVPRWTGRQRSIVKDGSFVAPVSLPGGGTVERPVFFNGFGHFGQVVTDMEKWPSYGTNIIQIEFGPNSVLPADGRTSDVPMRQMLKTLDRAQRAGVAVCLLISPHYFPQWALEKWPHLRKHREGFLQYCLHARESQELLRRYVAAAVAPLKDHPALHSICLTNEPVNQEEPCDAARKLWQAWLRNHHGGIAHLNACYDGKFASFAEVPLPNPFGARPAMPLWMDYVRFNQEFFAGWHKMLADAIHAAAPGLPVHAKAMTWTFTAGSDSKFGVDATLFGRFSDINGNDSVNFYQFGEGEFAQGWRENALAYDLQRSVLDAPVFNTENHIILDGETRYVPAAHIRAALWQEAIHGQCASAIWVWERNWDHKGDLAGNIMNRPACTEAVGLVNLDLNRAALEVTTLQRARPQVLLLQSCTAAVWDAAGNDDCTAKLYTAIVFAGLKAGFVTERQLEDGLVPDAPALLVPDIVHFSNAALAGLRKFKGRLGLVGKDDVLTADDYGHARSLDLPAERMPFNHGGTSCRDLHARILARLPAWDVRPAVELQTEQGRAVWGVEYRSLEQPDGPIVNLCNHLTVPVRVVLVRAGQRAAARDVLSGARVDGPVTLAPLEVRLLRLER